MGKYLSVILPAYNEEECICQNALAASAKIGAFCDDYEILVADDGSTDRTREEALRAAETDDHVKLVCENGHGGKGMAICVASAFAEGKYIAFCDADLELDPSYLEEFMRVIKKEKADCVIGSKLHARSHVETTLIRRIYSKGYSLMLKLLFDCPVDDTQTGIKLFRGDVMKTLCMRIKVRGYAFDAETICLMSSYGMKIVGVPVDVKYARARGRIGIKDALRAFTNTMGIFIRLKVTHYYRRNRVNKDTVKAVEMASLKTP